MSEFFSRVLPELFQANLTLSFSLVILGLTAVLIRSICSLKRDWPQWPWLILWTVLFLRSIVPASDSSLWSVLNLTSLTPQQTVEALSASYTGDTRTIFASADQDAYERGVQGGGEVIKAGGEDAYVVTGADGTSPPPTVETVWFPRLSLAWAAGVLGILTWGAVSYFRLKRRVRAAVKTKDGAWESDLVDAPFVLGFFPPKIYLPLALEEENRRWVLLHERAHIRCGHPYLKAFAFLALALHWYNPAMWIVWYEFCKDLESACDETVLWSTGEKKRYSSALLSLASVRPIRAPLAFGETGAKERIQKALSWRRPTVLLTALSLVVVLVSGTVLAAGPVGLPENAPALSVTTNIQSEPTRLTGKLYRQKDHLLEPPDWEGTPILPVTALPYVFLCFDDDPPSRIEAYDYLPELPGEKGTEWSLSSVNRCGAPGALEYGLHLVTPHRNSTGEGLQVRGVKLLCEWGVGLQKVYAQYVFRLYGPAESADHLRTLPAAMVEGQELPLTEGMPSRSITVTDPEAVIYIAGPQDGTVSYQIRICDADQDWRQLSASTGEASRLSTHGSGLAGHKTNGSIGVEAKYIYADGSARTWRGLIHVSPR